LNKICLHSDVPFFWDAWDVMHHNFETFTQYYASSSVVKVHTEQRIVIEYTYKLGDASTLKQNVCFYNDTARVDF
jgi:alpha-mannosidase